MVVLVVRALGYGRPRFYSREAGSAAAGIAYAFGPGMLPSAKESVREHLGAWLVGMGYHLGIFAGIAMVAIAVADLAPEGPLLAILRLPLAAGAVCGVILLVRRAVTPMLRHLSSPDDYLSNLLGTGLAALALAATFSAAARPVLLAEASVLFLYAPLGKIRHCFFFFTTRCFMGAHYGRRGTFPPTA
jgi:hypothetical protein